MARCEHRPQYELPEDGQKEVDVLLHHQAKVVPNYGAGSRGRFAI